MNIISIINRISIFFDLWLTYHYEHRIYAALAWELSGILNNSDALDEYDVAQ